LSAIVYDILIGKEAGSELVSQKEAEFEAGKGIVGDRYYNSLGTFSKKLKGKPDAEVTIIEQEEIDAFNRITGLQYTGKHFRRNLVTKGIRLNDLVGNEFYLGEVKLLAIRLCEPCAYLASIIGDQIMQHMVHKAGIRAQILSSGHLKVTDGVGRLGK
jgi:MOSC domain-containing protein YiiM